MNADFSKNCKEAGIFVGKRRERGEGILEVDIVNLGISNICKRENLY